jgi:segregation and condensation protein B
MQNIRNIIESLLFVSDEPLSVAKIKSVLETVETKEIKTTLHALADQYEARGGGFNLSEVAGGWQLRSRPEYHEWIKRMLQPSPQRLSKAALETLAIVAYNQPIIRADIEHIRGVDCGGILRQLLERKLVRVLGRKEIPGRPLIYATSKLFLELFDLRDLRDLPTPKEMEEMGITPDNRPGQPSDASGEDLIGTDGDLKIGTDEGFFNGSSYQDLARPLPGKRLKIGIGEEKESHMHPRPLQINMNTAANIMAVAPKIPNGKPEILAKRPTIAKAGHGVTCRMSDVSGSSKADKSSVVTTENKDGSTASSSDGKSKTP